MRTIFDLGPSRRGAMAPHGGPYKIAEIGI